MTGLDTDTFWHLATGRWLSAHGPLAATRDPFSYTSDMLWLYPEWLYEVLLYQLYTLGGLAAVIDTRLLLALGNAGLLFWLLRPAGASLAWLGVAFTAPVLTPYLAVRPHVLGYSLFLLLLLLLLEPPRRFRITLTFLLALAWANLHGSFIMAVLLLGLQAVIRPRDRLAWGQLGAAFVATLLNPRGVYNYLPAAFHAQPNLYMRSINELLPLDFRSNAPFPALVVGLAVVAMAGSLRRRQVFWFAMTAGLTVMTLVSTRHLPLLTFTALAVLARLTRWEPARTVALAAAVVMLPWGLYSLVTQLPRAWPGDRFLLRQSLPEDAVWFIAHNRLPGRLFHRMEWGGYLTWALPEQPVFIDARNKFAFSDRIYYDYLNIIEDGKRRAELLRKYDVRTVLVEGTAERPLTRALAMDPDWKLVYQDRTARVYVRADEVLGELRQPEGPGRLADDAYAALTAGRGEEAAALFTRAVAGDPWRADTEANLGVALARLGREDAAVPHWERALELDSTLAGPHFFLSMACEKRGDVPGAIRHLRLELRNAPQFEPAHAALRRLGAR